MTKTKKASLFIILFLLSSSPALAQAPQPAGSKPATQAGIKPKQKKTEKKPVKPASATYLKAEFIHGDFGLYGYNYYFNDLALEIEHHWSKRRLGLSGFSVGYRKEDFSSSDYGHFLNAKVFWKAEKHGFYFKPGVGGEWGKPSPRFEQTHFHYTGTTLVSYERIYLERNAWMPIGVADTGTLNPFFDASVGQKAGPFIFEGGVRVGYDKFVIDTFQFKDGNLTFQGLGKEYNFVPTVYFGIGLKLF